MSAAGPDVRGGNGNPMLASLLALVDERVEPPRAGAMREFAKAYTKRLSAEELGGLSADDLFGQVKGAFDLADGRGTSQVAVRVFNPTPERDGYQTAGTVVETNTKDSPFLFDSLHEELQARALAVRRVTHPVVGTKRSPEGRIEQVGSVREADTRESVMHFEVERRLSEKELGALENEIRELLGDVQLVVRDLAPMQACVRRMIEIAKLGASLYTSDEVAEAVAFLEWLLDHNFVFLGFREYDIVEARQGPAWRAVPGSGLGILSKEDSSAYSEPVPLASIEPALRGRIESGDLLVYSKTNRTSTVHRRVRMDYIGVRKVSADGVMTGEVRLLGLFTSKAYMEPAGRTPLLHRKLAQILEAEDLFEGSHDYKTVVSLFESFPKDELFSASVEELRVHVMGLLALQEQQHVRLFVRPDLFRRSVSVLVALPKERFSVELRHRLQGLFVERFHGSSVDYHLSLGESQMAQLHFTVHVEAAEVPEVAFENLEEEVVSLSRTWDDRLLHALLEAHGASRGRALFDRWGHRFPEYYRSSIDVELTLADIDRLEELESSDEAFVVGLANREDEGEVLTRVRLYKVGGKIQLSDLVPLLEALGLRVIEEWPTHLLGEEDERFLHDFGVLGADGKPLDVEAAGSRVADCISAVWKGEAENDSLNRLVVTAGLTYRQVTILRAYRKYHHRVSAGFPVEYKNDAFAANPGIAAKIIRLFEARFDSVAGADPTAVQALRAEILADLDAVRSLEQDVILRTHLGLVDATVRTNAYRPGRAFLSFKFRSADVPEMPKPTPLYEIFVYSPQMEGIHLRGGKVARGGIRWSDRRQDYRTEVLGLMKAQMVKNAVIVPTGSKGGFILKRPMTDPSAVKQEVTRQYVMFMRGLLDVTDDLVDGVVVHPPDVVVHDEDDPYLVVAADKGTATFSDTANAVAAEYGFWLGDAFASGGSAGYDHKKLGITARGAWESVKRHFRELGADVTSEPFTAVGIGDMSGDVFGNGMLLSDQGCLVAAFDHRHVFIDPNPVPAVGFAERTRLFRMPSSSWDDYDREKISAGGGVWPRTAKKIPLTPEIRGALGVDGRELTPDEVIKAILRAPVDLLWNGGIGTYVKSSSESNADVGDRANDTVRVNGGELRCRVVAEGGNLGVTQRGRIEYASAGGRVNTDFIDNSAGVDCSDHEVNMKILFGLAIRRGEFTLGQRNELLSRIETEVTEHVLYDNFLQAQILSQEVDLSPGRMEAIEDLMQTLETEVLLEREIESLPSSDEMAERRRAGLGMFRPELAILLAYAKRSLVTALLRSDLPDTPYLERDLRGYFPPVVVERFGHLLALHPLRRELIATIVANDVVNSQGITFATRVVAETGAEPSDVVRAYRIARDVTGAVRRWEEIEALVGEIEPAIHNELMSGVDRLVESTSRWYLAHASPLEEGTVAYWQEAFARLADALPSIGPEGWRLERERAAKRLSGRGVPEATARRHAFQAKLVHGADIVAVAYEFGHPVEEVARVFFLLGEALSIDWLEERLNELPTGSRWDRWALQAMGDDLLLVRRQLAERVIGDAGAYGLDDALDGYLASRAESAARLRRFMRTLAMEGVDDLAALTVAVRQIRALVG